MKKLFAKLTTQGQKLPWNPGLEPKLLVPPVPHPHPHEHLALLVSSEGLLLRPHAPNLTSTESHVRVSWGRVHVEEVDGEGTDVDWTKAVIVYGIVGILKLFSASYLLVITARSKVGHLLDPSQLVYVIKAVTPIPLEEERARTALNSIAARNTTVARTSLVLEPSAGEPGDTDDTPHRTVQFAPGLEGPSRPPSPSGSESELSSENSVVKVVASKLSFWTRLAKRAPADSAPVKEPEELDEMIREEKQEPETVLDSILATAASPTSIEEKNTELEEKIVRRCIREFTKGCMYFAHNFDITRSLQSKCDQIILSNKKQTLLAELDVADKNDAHVPPDKIDLSSEAYTTLPLWRRVDRHYWWNEWLSKPFIEAGLHSYVLPLMQGYVQVASFSVPREPAASEEGDSALVDYAIISRRSRDRAGLRYQRRGIDDDAHVANFVETETIMCVEREGYRNVFSYVQLRGSIPLYWTQSSYGLKPPPQLSTERTHDQNLDTLRRHLEKTISKYGTHSIVNLAEQDGKEGDITRAYREYVRELGSGDVQYYEYDFHKETRGMKYENIFALVEMLERTIGQQGYFWISNGMVLSRQKGVFRSNCIDCLDRTNIVQSAFARSVLNLQLGAVALLNSSAEEKMDSEVVFNDVWANNGDAISKAYANTSALKGDFTRTGRRDLGGLLNDGVNSLARMYSSTFSDWFSQAVIDFILGNRTLSVFSEFLHKLQSTDPRELLRLSKIRADAIATCVERVLSEGERHVAGWTVFGPEQMNAKVADKFEEKVLLLTVQAFYIVSYDYNLEKVKMYTRIPLGDILSVSKGAYILSPLEAASRDPLQNYGFILTWRSLKQITRVTSYSVRNSLEIPSPPPSPRVSVNFRKPASPVPSPLKATSFPGNSASPALHGSPPKGFRETSKQLSPSPSPPHHRRPRPHSMTHKRGGSGLSQLLSSALLPPTGETTFAAFKALPIDPARTRRASTMCYRDDSDMKVDEAANCKTAVDMIVETIQRACYDTGGANGDFVTECDIVSLAEAQKMTSVYAKMEYGVKRLLWLGS